MLKQSQNFEVCRLSTVVLRLLWASIICPHSVRAFQRHGTSSALGLLPSRP